MKKALVTGGSGFIGAYLTAELVGRGYDVAVFSRRGVSKLLSDVKDRITVYRGDISELIDVMEAMGEFRPDYVFHMAAVLGDIAYMKPMLAFRTNIQGTVNVLEASRLTGVERVVLASSIAVFSAGVPEPVTDDSPKMPTDPYGISKLFSELWSLALVKRYGLDVRGLRGPWIFGPGRTLGSTAFSSLIIQKPALGEPVEVPDLSGNWCYVKDFIDALITIAEAEDPKSRFYLVGGENLSTREVADIVRELIPGAQITIRPPTSVAAMWPRSYDDTKFRSDFKWKPKYTIREAIEDFIREVRKNPEKYS